MKSNMLGAVQDYQKIYATLKGCQEDLDGIDYSLSEAPWHCWEGEQLENEHEIFKNVNSAYQKLLKVLSEAIGSEQTEC